MKQLLKALADFQEEVPVIHEETKGYNYTYSNINTIFDVIKPLLKKHGLAFYQSLNGENLDTHLFHVEEGTSISSSVNIPKVKLGKMNEYQSLGSGITYLRRYSLSCMLGLITDKDIDGAGEEDKKLPNLIVNSTQYLGALQKKSSIEALKKHFTITPKTEESYNTDLQCDASEVDIDTNNN